MMKNLKFRQSPSSIRWQRDKFLSLVGRWIGRAIFPFLVLCLVSNTLLADDKQPAEGSTKAASQDSKRLQRILKNELPRDAEDLRVMQEHIQGLAEKALEVTVAIAVGRTQGSGVIVSADGYVLTAAHVAGRPNRRVAVIFPNGRVAQGYTLGAFRSADAGLIKLGSPNDEEDAQANWPFVEMGDSKKMELGQWCVATGHPGGFQPDRKPVVRVGRLVHKYKDVLTTDCTLISGDSGGPLFNLEGKVVGIHSRIGHELRHNVHVPVHLYQDNWDRLLKSEIWGEMPASPYIGVRGRNDIPRTQVSGVVKNGPAEQAGIQVGDVITKFGDDEVGDFDSLIALVGFRRPGEKVEVTLMRRKKPVVVTVTVGSVEEGSAAKYSPLTRISSPPVDRSANFRQTATGATYLGMWQQIALLRPVSVNQRNHASIRKSFKTVVAAATKSTVKIFSGDRVVALGVIVDRDGYILTKASQLPGKVECQLFEGKRIPASVVNIQVRHDLALLKVDQKDLPAIQWETESKLSLGSWLAVPGHLPEPIAIGVLSLEAPLSVKGGVLGVILGEREDGVGIQRVMPDGGGQRAGLRRGDVIVKVNSKQMQNMPMVVDTVRQHLPGEQVTLEIKRGEETLSIKATLGRIGDLNPTRQAVPQDKLGGPLSKRRSGFPTVLQHDTVLQPDQCGGPLIGLHGKAVGINIARAGRISTYALPSSVIVPLIKTMKQEAERDKGKKADTSTP